MPPQQLTALTEKDRRRVRGWITPMIAKLARWLAFPTDRFFGSRTSNGPAGFDLEAAVQRARRIDHWVAGVCIALAITYCVAGGSGPWFKYSALTIAFLFVLHVQAVALNLTIFDRWKYPAGHAPLVASHSRVIVLGFVNYAQLWLAFACMYSSLREQLATSSGCAVGWIEPLYFSATTQFTIGYGDIVPLGIVRVVVVYHSFASMLLLVLLVSRFVSVLRPEASLDDQPPGGSGHAPH